MPLRPSSVGFGGTYRASFGGSTQSDRPTLEHVAPHFLPALDRHINHTYSSIRAAEMREELNGAQRARTAPCPWRPTTRVNTRGKVFGGSTHCQKPHVKTVAPHFRQRIARHINWARTNGQVRELSAFESHLTARVSKFHVRTWVP
ncbi:hypothetical protein RI054_31g124440 [Pseudoscourfieldia marina]